MAGTVGATMARRKSGPKASGEKAPDRTRIVVQACEAWIQYVERGAKHCRTDVSKLIDAAVAKYLREQDPPFAEAPPDRVPDR